MRVTRNELKRQVDLEIMTEWVEPGSRVLDLGCGRGLLLDQLRRDKAARVVGVDSDRAKVLGAIKRTVPVYQGDIGEFLNAFPEAHFDWVVLSRTMQELENPGEVISRALTVGRSLAVGFVNYGYWSNRLHYLRYGRKAQNEVFPYPWHEERPSIPIAVSSFEEFCREKGYRVVRRVLLGGDWQSPVRFWPNGRAGYAVYEIRRNGA